MNALAAIAFVAEQKILEAQAEGVFERLPGAGKPLFLEEESHIPPEWRMARTILKNSGYLEPDARAFSKQPPCADKAVHNTESALRRFSLMMSRLRRARHDDSPAPELILEESPYFPRLLERMGRSKT